MDGVAYEPTRAALDRTIGHPLVIRDYVIFSYDGMLAVEVATLDVNRPATVILVHPSPHASLNLCWDVIQRDIADHGYDSWAITYRDLSD